MSTPEHKVWLLTFRVIADVAVDGKTVSGFAHEHADFLTSQFTLAGANARWEVAAVEATAPRVVDEANRSAVAVRRADV